MYFDVMCRSLGSLDKIYVWKRTIALLTMPIFFLDGSIQKVLSVEISNFWKNPSAPLSPVPPPTTPTSPLPLPRLKESSTTVMNFRMENRGVKSEKKVIFFVISAWKINIFAQLIKIVDWKKKCLRLFNKRTPVYAGLASKQQNIYQTPSILSERTLWKIRQFFSLSKRTDRLDLLPLFVFVRLLRTPLAPSTTNILCEVPQSTLGEC